MSDGVLIERDGRLALIRYEIVFSSTFTLVRSLQIRNQRRSFRRIP